MRVDGWVDVHAHFFPPQTSEAADELLASMRRNCWQVDEAPRWDAASTLAYMDRTGIQMQMLSYIPTNVETLRAANEFGASVVRAHPHRFGLLVALPTDDPDACLEEIARSGAALGGDGFAVTCLYKGVYLSDPRLEPVWAELDRMRATVFAHPYAYEGFMGRPEALLEVAFQTARTFVDMLYAGVFRRYPDIRFVVAHCGGALPAMSGRLLLLGNERWVPNPNGVTPTEMRQHLRRLFLDTAACCPTSLAAALAMTTPDRLVYGSDCGVPCTTDATMDANLEALLGYPGLSGEQLAGVGRRALELFPGAGRRIRARRADR